MEMKKMGNRCNATFTVVDGLGQRHEFRGADNMPVCEVLRLASAQHGKVMVEVVDMSLPQAQAIGREEGEEDEESEEDEDQEDQEEE
jgi:hypothetical protein